MEISLALQSGTTVSVTCDGQPSHTFDLLNLTPDKKIAGRPPQPLAKPAEYGHAVYDALFPAKSVASRMLASELKQPDDKKRLLLVATTTSLEAVAWEYACAAQGGFLAALLPFVRGLGASDRKDPPAMQNDLHVVAVAPNPAGPDSQGKALKALDVTSEPRLLEEALGSPEVSALVERAQPATLSDLRHHLADQRQRVVHFSGHSGIHEGQAALLFEKEDGTPAPIKGRELVSRIGDTAFLFVLSTHSAEKPAATEFPGLASALVKWGMPYALGMRFTIPDEAAALLNGSLYGELSRGVPVEQAVWQVRQKLQESSPAWLVGAPVLYTSLTAPAAGFALVTAAPAASVAASEAPDEPAAEAQAEAQLEEPAASAAEAVETAPEAASAAAAGQVMPDRRETVAVHLSNEQVQVMAGNTILVMTKVPEKRPEWRAALRANLNQAKQLGFQAEIEFFSALMGLLDDVPPSLPAASPYAKVITAIQDALSGKTPEPVEEVEPPKEVMNAVRELLQAKNPHALRKVIEKRQVQLFRVETQDFLASLAQEAQSTNDQQAMQVLVTYAGILQQCQQIGIEATFEQINQAAASQAGQAVAQAAEPEMAREPEVPVEAGPAIPDGFVARCVEGLRGGRPEHESLFNYLEAQTIQDEGFSGLLKTVKLALLGSNLQKLGKNLAGEYAAAWQEIVAQVSEAKKSSDMPAQ
jgi:hypothetical protein